MSIQDRLRALKQRIAHTPQRRTSQYIFQLGFDFGTSYSKCIYRELHRNRAWVFTFTDSQGRQQYLLSSSIRYRNGVFSLNAANVQYPENGLWHIKMALADMAAKRFNSPVLTPFYVASGARPGSARFESFVKCAALFFLSQALRAIRKHILASFPDYGAHPQDEMYVTMAIPVSNMADRDTEALFLQLLGKAWNLACGTELPDVSDIRWETMELLLKKPQPADDVCSVYPEVSANIQAFINSAASPGRTSNIYLLTDTGAGTVDQCCFTFYNRQGHEDSVNYFAASIFELGSGVIDRRCVEQFGGDVEQWRVVKESGNIRRIYRAVTGIENELRNNVAGQTLKQLQRHLYDGHGVWSPDSIRHYVFLIFAGGGDMNMPYHTAVIDSLRQAFGLPVQHMRDGTTRKEQWENRVITMPVPADLELPDGCGHWMKRLYVAYGISFNRRELPAVRLPDETALPQKGGRKEEPAGSSRKICPMCGGRNPKCLTCDGYGYID